MGSDDEISKLRANVVALEWALKNLALELNAMDFLKGLLVAYERAQAHGSLTPNESQALLDLIDRMAGIDTELHDYVRALRRDHLP